ncbi:MAG: TIGR04053 family radical SAM/SPASM domain-containing protein [Nitrososphaerota archaeon]|nr:TIGR04053 family radical SAM/SPASM domain-containing protein [Nitrososphaerota archaeon]MDG6932320.1 TIGR04053 family radical SAM/SPASM domain-containing protein [Nitrososphaerota archaeon]MDG6944638.1 TIGR04053 family radical SAM/SPASM domain-containing protein [Nitrososphaerota archaeon]
MLKLSYDNGPLIVFWETTKACELKCIHCRASAIESRSPEELTTEEAKNLFGQLAQLARPPVLIMTGGNPLIRDDIYELIKSASSAGLPVAISPAVSQKLNQDSLTIMKNAGAKFMSISLDGLSSTHEKIRGISGVYQETIKAINDGIKSGITVQVNTAVMKINYMELPMIFKVIYDLGIKIWEVFFLIQTGRGSELLDLTPEEYEAVCNFLYDASQYNVQIRTVECPFIRRVLKERSEGKKCTSPIYRKLNEELVKQMGEPISQSTLGQRGTLDGDGIIFIDHKGTIYPGGFLPLPIGNVRNDDLVKVYRESSLLKSIRNRSFNGNCGTCKYRWECGGSRARSFAYFGDPLGSDPACILNSPVHI